MLAPLTPAPAPYSSDALLRLLLNWVPGSLAILDHEMRYVVYTQQWVDQLPLGGQPLIGRSHPEVLPGVLPRWTEAHQLALRGESVSAEADSYQHPDGSKRWVNWEIQPWTDASNELAGSLITFEDITQQICTRDELRNATETVDSARQAKTRLLTSASYEVRSAMNSIIGMANLCLRRAACARTARHLQTIIDESSTLNSSFQDILDLSMIESGTLSLEEQEFHLDKVLSEVAAEIGPAVDSKNLTFTYELAGSAPLAILGDAFRLKQVLTALCENAVQVSASGEIELGVRVLKRDGPQATLEFLVRDTGPALSTEQQQVLAKPFIPGECAGASLEAKARLRLSICRSLVGLMNGEMRVETLPTLGNFFIFTATFGVSSIDHLYDEAPPRALVGAKLLIVDDHKLSHKTLARLLRSFKFQVEVADNGPQAIEMTAHASATGQPFQFVFMDYLMPGMDGLEATARLKERMQEGIAPKVILMTGYPLTDSLEELSGYGLDGYVSKPFTPSQIFRAMLEATTRWPENRPQPGDESPATVTPTSLRGMHILLVEDDPVNQEIVSEVLHEVGVTVDVAGNGKEGLEMLENRTPHAIIMDIRMPVMDGYEATCRIRDDERFAEVPIIALTANSMSLDRHACIEVGMNAHVAKPINPDQLVAVLAEWVEPIETPALPTPSSPIHQNGHPSPNGEAELEFINLQKALAMLGGRSELLVRLLNEFSDTHATTDVKIRAALDDGDLETAKRLVHIIKGLSGNVGAPGLERTSRELETALHQDPDHAESALCAMSTELQGVIWEINACPALQQKNVIVDLQRQDSLNTDGAESAGSDRLPQGAVTNQAGVGERTRTGQDPA